MLFIEEERIYCIKSREYFKEVVSSYSVGNYRSAMVMLYSVIVCDLIFKLQELIDLYDDEAAKKIIDEVREKDEQTTLEKDNKKNFKSAWERQLIEKMYNLTELIDDEVYTLIDAVRNHRHLAAHPAINKDFELVTPSKELTIGFIKAVLEKILIKPPLFVHDVVDKLTDDLVSKKEIYVKAPSELKKYLKSKYFDRMSDTMKKATFRTFWKFCFMKPMNDQNNSIYKDNEQINKMVLGFLYDEIENMEGYIADNREFFSNIPNDSYCIDHLCTYIAEYPRIYKVLNDNVKLCIKNRTNKSTLLYMISWFLSSDKKKHMRNMIENEMFDLDFDYNVNAIVWFSKIYEKTGDLEFLINYFIECFRVSSSFEIADKRLKFVKAFLEKMTREQYIKLIEIIDSNSQIHNLFCIADFNTELVKKAIPILGKEFNYKDYRNFNFSESVFETNNSSVALLGL